MAHLEIERRFLLRPYPLKKFLRAHDIAVKTARIEEFYLPLEDGHAMRYYRKQDDLFFMTVRRGHGLVREEEEREVDSETFFSQLESRRGNMIKKRRYTFEYGSSKYDLDQFSGHLKGLVILEIVFEDEKRALDFVLPEVFTPLLVSEVTDEERFSDLGLSKTDVVPSMSGGLKVLPDDSAEMPSSLKALSFAPYEKSADILKALIFIMLQPVMIDRDALLRGDDDPEHLHRFRVAIRRLRVLLTACDPCLETTWSTTHKHRLKALFAETNDKRDIDVYLERMPYYRSLLDDTMQDGLDQLERYLRSKEYLLQERLFLFMESDVLTSEITELSDFCHRDDEQALTFQSSAPIILISRRVIKKLVAVIVEEGRRVSLESASSHYHALRIQFKKLRYLSEFTRPLYDPEVYALVITEIKAIQDILGEHQDLEAQRLHLNTFAVVPQLDQKKPRKAIKALMKSMKKIEKEKRVLFQKAFAKFVKEKPVKRLLDSSFVLKSS
jgi:CHAD domain-containing protein/CYTH domain-containing protein